MCNVVKVNSDNSSNLPLGNCAKSADTDGAQIVIDKDTGEVRRYKRDKLGIKRRLLDDSEQKLERFSLQSTVRSLIPGTRTSKCMRCTLGGDVKVMKHNAKSHYKGLQTCGSVWRCPVCAAKISVRRKEECKQAMRSHVLEGGALHFMTLTFPHENHHCIDDLRKKQAKALSTFKSSYFYKKFREAFGMVGAIRNLEVTWGAKNGWHPHTHEVLFLESAITRKQFWNVKNSFHREWAKACFKHGLGAPTMEHGIDIQGGEKAFDYINKYGSELCYSHIKKAHNDRFTPFDLLRQYERDNSKLHGRKFVEFAEAFHGARQLYWSRGLKSKFNIDEVSDEEAAAISDSNAVEFISITKKRWKSVVQLDMRAQVLTICDKATKLQAERAVEIIHQQYIKTLKPNYSTRQEYSASYKEKFALVRDGKWLNLQLDHVRNSDVELTNWYIEREKVRNRIVQSSLKHLDDLGINLV